GVATARVYVNEFTTCITSKNNAKGHDDLSIVDDMRKKDKEDMFSSREHTTVKELFFIIRRYIFDGRYILFSHKEREHTMVKELFLYYKKSFLKIDLLAVYIHIIFVL
ncbi:hypothetical protein ACJX0J_007244, partial [Zea mays]